MQDQLRQALDQSASVSQALQEILCEEATLDNRGRLAMAYLSLALEHREALLLLVHAGAYPSATALQRPMLEALVAGVWIDYGATDEQVQQMCSRKRPRSKFETMVQKLREVHPLGKWFEVFRNHYEILGDYTHGHFRQISRWISSAGIGPSYAPMEMIETLRYADVIGVIAAIHREKLAGRPIDRLSEMLESAIYASKLERVKGIEPSS